MVTLMILTNVTAYATGEIIGVMIPIGIVALIIWGIVKATKKRKVKN